MPYPSALAPQFFNLDIFLNRACILLFAGGLLAVVSTILSRQSPQGRNVRILTAGTVSVALSVFAGFLVWFKPSSESFDWQNLGLHITRQYRSDSQTNIESISGRVEIFPGTKNRTRSAT